MRESPAALEDFQISRYGRFPGKAPRVFANPRAIPRRRERQAQALSKCRGISRRNEPAEEIRRNNFRQPADFGGHHWQTAGERFQDDIWHSYGAL